MTTTRQLGVGIVGTVLLDVLDNDDENRNTFALTKGVKRS